MYANPRLTSASGFMDTAPQGRSAPGLAARVSLAAAEVAAVHALATGKTAHHREHRPCPLRGDRGGRRGSSAGTPTRLGPIIALGAQGEAAIAVSRRVAGDGFALLQTPLGHPLFQQKHRSRSLAIAASEARSALEI
ncbi:hypothetical protein [Sorangium sp. So ce1335]|uniref:hypothetical protein n=1 Tax=Sorangium sp. So ce1335 TaxID=3133335 RepID=UPI003F6243FD